jgi:hypothetical protein
MRYRSFGTLAFVVLLAGFAQAADRTTITFADGRIFPESLTSTRNGDIYFGALGQDAVYKAPKGSSVATVWVKPKTANLQQVLGMSPIEAGLAYLPATVVIFFGDHGQSHVRGKQFCYESGLHIPLLIRWPSKFPAPKGVAAGTVDDRLLEAIDLSATTLSILGVDKPPAMQGRVFLGDKAEAPRELVFGARDRCDETVDRIRTVRDRRYRYLRNFMPERPLLQRNRYKERSYPVWNLIKELAAQGKLTPEQAFLAAPTRPAEELYDLEKDPYEIRNLAASPQHAEILNRLRGELERWIESTQDQGRTPEPPELLEALERKALESDAKSRK